MKKLPAKETVVISLLSDVSYFAVLPTLDNNIASYGNVPGGGLNF
jgi:hypothetical protein